MSEHSTPPPGPPRLIADIGGTNARFALLERARPARRESARVRRLSRHRQAIESYLESSVPPRSRAPREAALAIAGPITATSSRMTNHAWQFSAARTRQALGWRRLIMVNDFTALAMAIRHLPRAGVEQIGGGQAVPDTPLALLGPGPGSASRG